MKRIISILFFTFFISFQKDKSVEPDKIIVLINQVPWERPIANTIETFWQDKEHFDTIQITGKTLVKQVNETLNKLIKENDYADISYESCIIRYSRGQVVDTFYSWRWFDHWKKGSTMYIDSTKKLEELFVKFYHIQLTR